MMRRLICKQSWQSSWLILFVITALSAFLRLHRLDLIDIRYDEALAPLQALNITQGEWLAVAPFSGSLINHPPLFLYILAVPYIFTHNLILVTAYRALLDVMAVLLCWLVCRRYFGLRVAHLAALLYAVAPWAIQSARKLSIEALPLCSLLLVWGLLRVAHDHNAHAWAMVGLGLALCIGVHLSAVSLVIVVLVVALIHRDTLQVKPVLIGLLPLIILTAIYILYDVNTGLANFTALLSTPSVSRFWTADGLLRALWMSGGAHLSDLTGSAFPLWAAQPASALAWIDSLQMGVLMLASAFVLLDLRRSASGIRSPILIVLLWWWVPILGQVYVSQPVQMHYFTLSYPAPFILMALFANHLIRTRAQWRWGVAPVLTLVVLWQGFTTLRFAQFIGQHDTSGGYGRRLSDVWEARTKALAQLEPDQALIAVIKGFPTPWNEQAVVLRVVLADVPHRFLNSESDGVVVRAGTPSIFLFAADAAPMQSLVSEALSAETVYETDATVRSEDRRYTVVRADPFDTDTGSHFAVDIHPVWANQLQLHAYRVTTSAQVMRIEAVFNVLQAPPPGADYHWTFRLLAGDQQIAQQDIAGVHPSSWRVGDRVYLTLTLPLPAGGQSPTNLRVGSYTYPDIKSVMVAIPGQPPTDSVVLPIVR